VTFDQLNLAEPALSAARALQAAHPDVVFTSGRRGVPDQARAMAQNVMRNRKWIARTYVATPSSRALQAWVDGHPLANQVQVEGGLAAIMASWSDAQKAQLSAHFSGHAFDVQPLPDGPRAEAVKAAIRALPGLTKFLESEGGLVRWHAQFA
jgi:hypothetical protein